MDGPETALHMPKKDRGKRDKAVLVDSDIVWAGSNLILSSNPDVILLPNDSYEKMGCTD